MSHFALLGAPTLERIPAESPIGGPIWTIVVPVLLFATTFVATWLLYRRFSRGGPRYDRIEDPDAGPRREAP